MKREKGFVALITVLIISAVLLVSVVSFAQYGIATRFALLNLENKTRSEHLANACISIARIALLNDPSYTTTDTSIKVGADTCRIESVTTMGSNRRIKASAVVHGATTNVRVDINPTTGAVVAFTELAI